MKRAQGFTLIETLVVLAIVAILARYAYPSYQKLIRGSRLSGQSTLVLTSLYQARSEAIRRVKKVSICPSDYANSGGTPTCLAKDKWATGWIVFVPPSTTALGTAGSTAEILVAQGTLANTNTLKTCKDNASTCTAFAYLTYDANGIATVDNTPNLPYMCFQLFDSKGTAVVNGIEVQMSITGRPASRTSGKTNGTSGC
jgi:type IV fimbrial biogenesis protein FimT